MLESKGGKVIWEGVVGGVFEFWIEGVSEGCKNKGGGMPEREYTEIFGAAILGGQLGRVMLESSELCEHEIELERWLDALVEFTRLSRLRFGRLSILR